MLKLPEHVIQYMSRNSVSASMPNYVLPIIAYGPPGGPGHAAAAIGVEKGLAEGFSG